MPTLCVPPLDAKPWPTLGPELCDWIEAYLVYGPGPLAGQPYVVEPEFRAQLYRLYEVHPRGADRARRRRFKRGVLSLRKGTAKALSIDTPILTTSGWSTMGDLVVGDVVFDAAGRPTTVVGASEVFEGHDCYRVKFNDGAALVADAGHRWAVREWVGGGRKYVDRLVTTAELAESVRVDRPLTTGRTKATRPGVARWRVGATPCLATPNVSVPIDPYLLGYWLGDGASAGSVITAHEGDLDNLSAAAAAAGHPLGKVYRRGAAVQVSPAGLRSLLLAENLLGARREGLKRVPRRYLHAGTEQRRAILQGLMDSDGTIGKDGACAFTSTSEGLSRDVAELARSLGLKPTVRPGRARLKGRDVGEVWRVHFAAHVPDAVFRLPRKAARLRAIPDRVAYSKVRTVVAVERTLSVPTRCIAVDSPDHLFLAGRELVPTHNSEKAAIITCAEAHPEAPVRCDGFRRQGSVWVPVGRGVVEPYIPMVAYTEEQSEDLAYGAVRRILSESAVSDRFDIGLDRVLVLDDRGREAGKISALAGSPNARDGARTTFQHLDETHRMTSARLRSAYSTMGENLFKRVDADPWMLETTTVGEAGQGSIAETTHDYAEQIAAGLVKNPQMFFFHRQATELDPDAEVTPAVVREKLLEASGPAAVWSGDIDGLVDRYFEPDTDRAYFERVWFNVWRRGGAQAFDVRRWRDLALEPLGIEPGRAVVLAFDGSYNRDATVLRAVDIDRWHYHTVGVWERAPTDPDDWEVDQPEVDQALAAAMKRWDVWRLYADPHRWGQWLDQWAGEYGSKRIVKWDTTKYVAMAEATRLYARALAKGEFTHDGDPQIETHIGNARRRTVKMPPADDEDQEPLWVPVKEYRHSPRRIDGAITDILGAVGRLEAIAAGVKSKKKKGRRAAGF